MMQSFLGISNHFLQRAMVAKHVKMHAYCWLSGINRKELNCVTKYIYLLKKDRHRRSYYTTILVYCGSLLGISNQ